MVKVPKAVKDATWKKYMSNKNEGKCYCCGIETISVFNFEIGHNKARSKGGGNQIENLRPICKTCNTSMGTQSIESFRKKHFTSNRPKRTTSPSSTTKRKLVTRQKLNEITLKQLKFLARKHKITVSGSVYENVFWGSKRIAPTKRQYVNALFGVVRQGEKLSE